MNNLQKGMIGSFLAAMTVTGWQVFAQEPKPLPSSMNEAHESLKDRAKGWMVVYGIGIQASKVDGGIRIDKLMLKGDAIKGGLKKGDVITHIDGKPARDHTLKENLELIAHTTTYEVLLVYKKAGVGDDFVVRLDKNKITPDREYVDVAPVVIPPPSPRVAYYTVVQRSASLAEDHITNQTGRLRIVADEASNYTKRLKAGSCVKVDLNIKQDKPDFVKVFGQTADGEKIMGTMHIRDLTDARLDPANPRCFGTFVPR